MPKFRIHAVASMSKFVGEVEADTKAEALKKAEDELDIESPALCHGCSEEWEAGDVQELIAEED